MTGERIIWQYWETKGRKPAFIEDLHEIAKRNAGAKIIQVTPETLPQYLPNLSSKIHAIDELAHKADMIRTRLVQHHGGMWLDSDAIVLRDLNWIFDKLKGAEFVGFNDTGHLRMTTPPRVRVNCFAAPAGSQVMTDWVAEQEKLLPKGCFRWEEIGTELLDPICLARSDRVSMLPFHLICPVSWQDVRQFGSPWRTPRDIIDDVSMVMLSNKSLQQRYPELQEMQIKDIMKRDIYVAHFLRRAVDSAYYPKASWQAGLSHLASHRDNGIRALIQSLVRQLRRLF